MAAGQRPHQPRGRDVVGTFSAGIDIRSREMHGEAPAMAMGITSLFGPTCICFLTEPELPLFPASGAAGQHDSVFRDHGGGPGPSAAN